MLQVNLIAMASNLEAMASNLRAWCNFFASFQTDGHRVWQAPMINHVTSADGWSLEVSVARAPEAKRGPTGEESEVAVKDGRSNSDLL